MPEDEWRVQPRGRRAQRVARSLSGSARSAPIVGAPVPVAAQAAAASWSGNADVSDCGSDAEVIPSIAALEAEIKCLREVPPTDALVGHLLVAKKAEVVRRKEAFRVAMPFWKQNKMLGRKIERAMRFEDKLVAKRAAIISQVASLQLSGQGVDGELHEVRARITSLQADVAAVAVGGGQATDVADAAVAVEQATGVTAVAVAVGQTAGVAGAAVRSPLPPPVLASASAVGLALDGRFVPDEVCRKGIFPPFATCVRSNDSTLY